MGTSANTTTSASCLAGQRAHCPANASRSSNRSPRQRIIDRMARSRARAGMKTRGRASTGRKITGGKRRAAIRGRRAVGMSAGLGGVGKTAGMSTGYKSKAQWRLFFARPDLRRYAKRKAHATKGGKIVRYRRLPERKGVKKNPR